MKKCSINIGCGSIQSGREKAQESGYEGTIRKPLLCMLFFKKCKTKETVVFNLW